MIKYVFNEKNFGKSILDLIDDIAKTNDCITEDSIDYDIYEESGETHFIFEMPGFDKKDISIELTNDSCIYIVAKKSKISEISERKYIEQNSDNIKKYKIKLVQELIAGDIKTSLKDGILTVSIKPKNERKIINID